MALAHRSARVAQSGRLGVRHSLKSGAASRPLIFALSTVSFLALWELASRVWIRPVLLPPPSLVLATAGPMLSSGELPGHISASLIRIGVGFSLGSAVAIALGIVIGRVRLIAAALDPVIQPLRFLSPTAMIPLAIIWFGIGESSKYFLIFYATVFIVMINTVTGVVNTPLTRIRAAQSLGAKDLEIFWLVVLPSAVPYIVSGMRIALASAFMAIIPAEMLAADSGLGYLLQQSGLLLQTNRIFVALAVISAIGFLADGLFRLMVGRLARRYLQVPL